MADIISRGQKRTDGLAGRLTFQQGKNRILGQDAAGLARMIILADGTSFRIKISESGKDVRTAEPDELVMDSDNNLFKIVDSGVMDVEFPAVGGGGAGTFSESGDEFVHNHDLGKPPLVIGFIDTKEEKSGSNSFHNAEFNQNIVLSSTAAIWRSGRIYTTENTINYVTSCVLFGQTPSGNPFPAFETQMRWYIIRETASTDIPTS